jgi:hypothetical protein
MKYIFRWIFCRMFLLHILNFVKNSWNTKLVKRFRDHWIKMWIFLCTKFREISIKFHKFFFYSYSRSSFRAWIWVRIEIFDRIRIKWLRICNTPPPLKMTFFCLVATPHVLILPPPPFLLIFYPISPYFSHYLSVEEKKYAELIDHLFGIFSETFNLFSTYRY